MLRRHRMLLGLGALGLFAGALALLLCCYWSLGPPQLTEDAPTLAARIELVARTPGYFVSAAFGAAVIFATLLGCWAARRIGAWPHWPALVRGIGKAGFLAALIFAFLGMSLDMKALLLLGSAGTPPFLIDGFAICFGTLTLGPAVLLLSIAGATLMRTLSRTAG